MAHVNGVYYPEGQNTYDLPDDWEVHAETDAQQALDAAALAAGDVGAAVLAEAKDYARDQDDLVRAYAAAGDIAVKGYADTGDANTLNAAQGYADTGDAQVTTALTEYVDDNIWQRPNQIVSTIDLDDMMEGGVHPMLAVPADWVAQHYPADTVGNLEVFVLNVNANRIQRFTALTDFAPIYTRRWNATTGWSEWRRVSVNDTNVWAHPANPSIGVTLDTMTDPGVTPLPSYPTDWAAQGYPGDVRGTLEVFVTSASMLTQRFMVTGVRSGALAIGQPFIRVSTDAGSSWSAWVPLGWQQFTNGSVSLDLDAFTAPGMWPLGSYPTDWEAQNYPGAMRGTLEVATVGTRVAQWFHATGEPPFNAVPQDPLWHRVIDPSNPVQSTEWKNVTQRWNQPGDGSVSLNLDTYTTSGMWPLESYPTDWQAQNYPGDVRGSLTVSTVGTRVTQWLHATGERKAQAPFNAIPEKPLWHRVIDLSDPGQSAEWENVGNTPVDSRPEYLNVPRSWDGTRGLLNGGSPDLRSIRVKVRRALAGLEDCHLMAIGDSKTIGRSQHVTLGPRDSYVAQFGDLVGARVGTIYAIEDSDQRWTSSGITFTRADISKRYSEGIGWIEVDTSTEHTGVTVYARSATAQAVTVRIDGVDHAWNMAGTGTWEEFTQDGLANGSHVVRLTSTAQVAVLGVHCRYDTPGLQISNAARGGTQSQHWLPSAGLWSSHWATSVWAGSILPAVDLLIVGMGTNDRAPEQLPNLPLLYESLASTGIPTLAVAPGGVPVTEAWNTMRATLGAAADTHDLPLVDFTHIIGDDTTADANGLKYDALHENTRGHSVEADAIARVLTY